MVECWLAQCKLCPPDLCNKLLESLKWFIQKKIIPIILTSHLIVLFQRVFTGVSFSYMLMEFLSKLMTFPNLEILPTTIWNNFFYCISYNNNFSLLFYEAIPNFNWGTRKYFRNTHIICTFNSCGYVFQPCNATNIWLDDSFFILKRFQLRTPTSNSIGITWFFCITKFLAHWDQCLIGSLFASKRRNDLAFNGPILERRGNC